MKNLYLIGGPMGVGKTAVAKQLTEKLYPAVFLDGDWCWNAEAMIVTEETKRMVKDNICHLLNNYIKCSEYHNIIFTWVMHTQDIVDDILNSLNTDDVKVHVISLIATPRALTERLEKDIAGGIRQPDIIRRSLERLEHYKGVNSIKIDTTGLSIDRVSDIIKNL